MHKKIPSHNQTSRTLYIIYKLYTIINNVYLSHKTKKDKKKKEISSAQSPISMRLVFVFISLQIFNNSLLFFLFSPLVFARRLSVCLADPNDERTRNRRRIAFDMR